jgi:hypothetical protein
MGTTRAPLGRLAVEVVATRWTDDDDEIVATLSTSKRVLSTVRDGGTEPVDESSEDVSVSALLVNGGVDSTGRSALDGA